MAKPISLCRLFRRHFEKNLPTQDAHKQGVVWPHRVIMKKWLICFTAITTIIFHKCQISPRHFGSFKQNIRYGLSQQMGNLFFVGQGNTCQAIKLFIDYKILYIVTTLFFSYTVHLYCLAVLKKIWVFNCLLYEFFGMTFDIDKQLTGTTYLFRVLHGCNHWHVFLQRPDVSQCLAKSSCISLF